MRHRDKGIRFEREVAAMFTDAGFDVRGLESSGDHLILSVNGVTLASECKRQERLSVGAWWAQAVSDAPAGTVPLVTFKTGKRGVERGKRAGTDGETLSIVRTADLLRLLTGDSVVRP